VKIMMKLVHLSLAIGGESWTVWSQVSLDGK
jgi:hypothetical protein